MVTKEEAIAAGSSWGRVEFHYGPACTPKRVERWRMNGACKTWATRPDEFRLPVKYGLRDYSYITNSNAHEFHLATDCPLDR